MQATEPPGELSRERVVAFIDIGTNSIRMFIVRLFPNCSYNVLSRQKETVRLGEGEYRCDLILDTAIDRAVTVCRNFTGLARSFSTDEIVAVATSAAREAKNRNVLLNRLRHEASIDVRVISGRDEARLIYMGVVTGIHLGAQQAVFIDIGGGSTEIAIGGQHTSCHLESLLLGSIRLTNLFFSGNEEKPVHQKKYERIKEHVRSVIEPALPGLRSHHFDTAIGSSGTIINLAEIAIKTGGGSGSENGLSRAELSRVAAMLCSLPLSLRRKVPGINPERGDIIICGAAILETLMDALDIDRIASTTRGLQDGLLADYLSRMKDFPLIGSLSVRERSVLQLARSCGINEHHARTVARLAQELFTSARGCGLHAYADQEEELLVYATFLHDVGSFISYTNHHVHSYYLIKNSELSGFLPREILLMASLARYHRKRPPKKKTLSAVLPLQPGDQELIQVLSEFLRMVESLDRSHTGLIRHARFLSQSATGAVLELTAVGECQLELSGIENEADNFRHIFGKSLITHVVTADLEELHERNENFPALFNSAGDRHVSE